MKLRVLAATITNADDSEKYRFRFKLGYYF